MLSRKRKQRAILSCNDCRRRKLSCNRELPCSRCIQGGIAGRCSYTKETSIDEGNEIQIGARRRSHTSSNQSTVGPYDAELEESNQRLLPEYSASSTHANTDRVHEHTVRELEQRIATLEAALHASKHEPSETYRSGNLTSKNLTGNSMTICSGFFKGGSYQTYFYGPTNPMFVPAHFPDLRPFMKRIYVNSTLSRIRQDMSASEERSEAKQPAPTRVLAIPNLRSILPDRNTVDKIVKTYFDIFEATYRILHAPTFWGSYRAYWDPSHPSTASDFEMDAIILSILACTLCISTHDTTRHCISGSTFRAQAVVWIRACEAWLKQQSHKHRSLASVQVRFLRLLALSTNCLKSKQYYEEVQNLIVFMRSIGMHRDPRILGNRCSAFEGEMRRRLWATAMELELQASIDKGVPSVISDANYDCDPPRNIDDSDLLPATEHLPLSQPPSNYTSTSFLYHASKSLFLRRQLCTQLNSLHPHSPTIFSPNKSESELLKALSLLPKWEDNPQALQSSTLLDLLLRQWLMHFHKPEVLHLAGVTQNPLYHQRPSTRYAIIATLEAASSIITSHARLLDANTFALCCMRSDYLSAAFLVCHIAYHAYIAGDSMMTALVRSMFAQTMDIALRVVEERCLRPGRGNHKFWFLSAACSLAAMQWEEDPARREALEKSACERVCKVLYKILALRDEDWDGDGADGSIRFGAKGVCEMVLLGPVSTITTSSTATSAPLLQTYQPASQSPLPTSSFPIHTSPSITSPLTFDTAALAPFHSGSGGADEAWMLNDMWFMDDLGDGFIGYGDQSGGNGFGYV
ncbi:unnamed protein product [Periconia digitata]|uniref:Zn(2)-C6 fungal-type domain-containing protein n=1 Tax=Periconia digitata TaxID=1303443 RepID=A0A9W4XMC4_9PLEO|nr:unnamed protein product [Periconia digitata]